MVTMASDQTVYVRVYVCSQHVNNIMWKGNE